MSHNEQGNETVNGSPSTTNGISRYPVPEIEDCPPEIQDLLNYTKNHAPFTPNIQRAYAHRPEIQSALLKLFRVILEEREGGHVNKADRVLIAIAVAALEKCPYNIPAQCCFYRKLTGNEALADQVAADWETADLSDQQRAILKFALRVAKCESIDDSHFEELQQAGLDREDGWDIGAVASFYAMLVRDVTYIGLQPNPGMFTWGRAEIKE